MRALGIVAVCCGLVAIAHANGRPPLTNGIHFNASDPHSMYVASTFGLLISHDDGCTMNWICEDNLGYGGTWDPKYAIATDGTIFATTYTGLRVSRDGGCSFATATAELAMGAPNRIAGIWIDALDLGPTGDVWVGTAESGQPNEVYVSHDNGMSFTAVGLQSPTIFWKSVRVAPTNMMRVYASGYEVATPTAHLEITNNGGATWTASPLTGVAYGTTPIVLVAAVDTTTPDTFYLISVGASLPGDKLYRTTDGGQTFTDVLDSPGPVQNVIIKDSQNVYVTTMVQSGTAEVGGPAFHSIDGGVTFPPIPNAPQLACLGIAPDGSMIGCGANWVPDYEAVARSTDGAQTFTKVWRFVEMFGPLQCPSGTVEHDECDVAEWPSIQQQFGTTGPTCGSNVEPGDPPPVVAPKKSGGCCDAGGSPLGVIALGLVVLFAYTRSRHVG
jgi:hypothetical protein